MSHRTPLVMFVGAALSCGAPAPPASPAAPPGRRVQYAPLAALDDQRAPAQLVLLGTDAQDGATVLRVPALPRATAIETVVMTGGAASTVTIALATAPIGAPSPAAPSGGAALALAAGAASAALGRDRAALAVTAVPAGATDDPGSAAALAAGAIATVTGAAIDPRAAVIGAVAPDGTILPVPDLAERWLAALARGKTRVGYPTGARRVRARGTGPEVDLVAVAREHRADAVELADVGDAYRVLTGGALPAPVPVDDADLALPPEAAALIARAHAARQRQLASEWAAVLQLEQAGRLPPAVAALAAEARRAGAAAERARRAGEIAAAYRDATWAFTCAAAANATFGVVLPLVAGDVDAALAAIDALAARVAPPSPDALTRIGALPHETLRGALGILAGLEAATRAASAARASRTALTEARAAVAAQTPRDRAAPPAIDALADALAQAAHLGFRALVDDELASLEVALSPDGGPAFALDTAKVWRDARAAIAAATTVQRRAAARGAPEGVPASPPVVATPLADTEHGRAHALEGPAQVSGEGAREAALRARAEGELAWRTHAADLLAREGAIPPKAADEIAARAARAARAAARAARVATGEIPVHARLAYQRARADAAQPAVALLAFWEASAWCDLAQSLARP